MGGCQNYGPFLGTLNIRCRIIMGTQKGTIILTTTHIGILRVYQGLNWDNGKENGNYWNYRDGFAGRVRASAFRV